jgi:predicted transglutaminase-like cysteine proteinase
MSGRLPSALVALACLLGSAEAAPRLQTGADATPLSAWVGFCERHPAECRIDTSEPETVVETPELIELIETVNRHVNHTVKATLDQEHWGKPDQWDLAEDGRGDCEDYQLLKRKILAESGLPRRALRMTVVLDLAGQGHAVLTIRTAQGDLILDNLTDAVRRWQETPYVYLKRESAKVVGWATLVKEPERPVVAMAE